MKIHRIKTIAVILAFPLFAAAQKCMNLRECMEYALAHSTKMEIGKLDYDDALVQRRSAILSVFTPSVSAGTNAFTNFGRAIDPETNSYISMTSFSNSYSMGASLTLFDGFMALNNMKIAKTAVKMGLSNQQKLNDEICLSVMQAYYNMLFQSEMTDVILLQVQTYRQNLSFIRKQYDLGHKSYADVAQTEADLAEQEYRLVNSRNLQNEALLNLKAIMLWSADDTLLLDRSVVKHSVKLMDSHVFENSGGLMEYAKMSQPSVLLAKGRMQNAKYALRSARGQFFPTLTLSGGWSTSYITYPGKSDYRAPSFSTQFRNNRGEYVQVSMSIPIYDRYFRISNLKRKKNDFKRATAEYRQTLKDVEIEVSRALQDFRGAYSALLQAEKRMQAQDEAYKLNERKFAQGLISPIEFQTVSNSYLNAKAERLDAMLKYKLKHSVVNFYKGISYLEQQK